MSSLPTLLMAFLLFVAISTRADDVADEAAEKEKMKQAFALGKTNAEALSPGGGINRVTNHGHEIFSGRYSYRKTIPIPIPIPIAIPIPIETTFPILTAISINRIQECPFFQIRGRSEDCNSSYPKNVF